MGAYFKHNLVVLRRVPLSKLLSVLVARQEAVET